MLDTGGCRECGEDQVVVVAHVISDSRRDRRLSVSTLCKTVAPRVTKSAIVSVAAAKGVACRRKSAEGSGCQVGRVCLPPDTRQRQAEISLPDDQYVLGKLEGWKLDISLVSIDPERQQIDILGGTGAPLP